MLVILVSAQSYEQAKPDFLSSVYTIGGLIDFKEIGSPVPEWIKILPLDYTFEGNYLFGIEFMSWDEKSFLEKLEGTHQFPGHYSFKFIVKPEHQAKVEALLQGADVKLKPSSGNKYVSVTLSREMNSSLEVVEVYKEANKIDGIIAL